MRRVVRNDARSRFIARVRDHRSVF
jgi:hypothetical protein